MQNRTDMVGISIPDRLRQFASGNRQRLEMAGAALAGFIMANSFIFGQVAPFGVALVPALSGKFAYCAALGAVLGYALSFNMVSNIKYIAAIVLVVALKWLAENKLGKKHSPLVSVGVSFLGMGVAASALLVALQPTMYDVLLNLAEVLMACGAAYFFSRSLAVADVGLASASRSDLSCVVITFAIVTMGFSPITIGGLSLGRILCVIAILLCARHGGEAAGAICGITAGIAMGLSGKEYAYVVCAYSLGGLVAGVFGHTGRLAAAGAFVVVNALTALFVTGQVDVYTAVFEIFVASVIFTAIPQPWVSRLKLQQLSRGDSGASTQTVLRDRLGDVSEALKEISETTHQVSEKLGKLEGSSMKNVYTQVSDKVCRHCGMRTSCWQFRTEETVEAMDLCLRTLKKDGSINKENLPAYLAKNCCKLDMLLGEMNTRFQDYMAKEGVTRKVSKVRGVVTDQFEGIAMMLDEVSGELTSFKLLEPQKTQRIRDYFQKQGLSSDQVLSYLDSFGRTVVEVVLPSYQMARFNKTKATLDLCTFLEVEFDLPQVTTRELSASIVFTEKANLSVELGGYQIASGGARLCGDAYDYVRNQGGKTHLVLSDGMGSGGSAAVDSNMAAGLITRLLTVGVGHEAALKMVNSALLVKSGEESLATIDICTIDLFTGGTEFYKAGAAPTYILRGERAGYVESTSLPAGILRGVAFEKSRLSLHAGDRVVMVSDGVIASGTEWVQSELESLRELDIQRMCEKLATTAKMRRADGREDDITVLAAALHKG